jgi:hypothetical protein
VLVTENEDLRRSVVFYQGDDRCTCRYLFKSLGQLYGVGMGRGWVRMTTEPGCPHHAPD